MKKYEKHHIYNYILFSYFTFYDFLSILYFIYLFRFVYSYIIPTTFMLRVSFSPAPECVDRDCWNSPFSTPPRHQGRRSCYCCSCYCCFFRFCFTLVFDALSGRRFSLHNELLDPPLSIWRCLGDDLAMFGG